MIKTINFQTNRKQNSSAATKDHYYLNGLARFNYSQFHLKDNYC